MLLHEISRKDIEGRLFMITSDERPVLLARANEAGVFEAMPRCPGLKGRDRGQWYRPDDSRSARESACADREQRRTHGQVAGGGEWHRPPQPLSYSLCHFRKGGGEDGNRDAIRGGGAFVDG